MAASWVPLRWVMALMWFGPVLVRAHQSNERELLYEVFPEGVTGYRGKQDSVKKRDAAAPRSYFDASTESPYEAGRRPREQGEEDHYDSTLDENRWDRKPIDYEFSEPIGQWAPPQTEAMAQQPHLHHPFLRRASTCSTSDSTCINKMCTAAQQTTTNVCTKVGGGADCEDGTPPQELCESDCSECSTGPSPTLSPTTPKAPTTTYYWKPECSNVITTAQGQKKDSCMPSWCNIRNNSACATSILAANAEAESLLLEQLPAMECNPFCNQSKAEVCTRLATIFNGRGSVKAAYCTGTFLVVWSTGQPGHNFDGWSIPRPPGGASCSYKDCDDDDTYAGTSNQKCVVRTKADQYLVFKFPLNVTDFGPNTVMNTVEGSPSEVGGRKLWSQSRLPSGAVGVAVNGIPIYPSLQTGGYEMWEACEGDFCSAHAGRGADYHYHGK